MSGKILAFFNTPQLETLAPPSIWQGEVLSRAVYGNNVSSKCRVKYSETVLDIKKAIEKKQGLPIDKQQLFHNCRELTTAWDNKTLYELGLHTGFSIKGYDLVRKGLSLLLPPCMHA
jgi:Ubiquitin family